MFVGRTLQIATQYTALSASCLFLLGLPFATIIFTVEEVSSD